MNQLNYWAQKLGSRKFIVFVTATVFAAVGILTGGQWMTIGLAYFGIQYLQKQFIEGNNGVNNNNRDHGGVGPTVNRRADIHAEGHSETGRQE